MKPDSTSIEKLRSDIRRQFDAAGLSYSAIGDAAQVHTSQVSRICRGKFRTVSHNVVQVCKVLGVKIETVRMRNRSDVEALGGRLQRGVLDVWDRTATDADRLLRFLRDLGELRRASRASKR